MSLPHRHRGRRGFALILTLSFLALIVLLAILYLSVTRFESHSARSRFEVERARAFAGMAVNDVVVKLRDNIPVASTAATTNQAGPNCAWAAAPGRLVVPKDQTPTGGFRTVLLYSDAASNGTANTGTVDLNQPMLGESAQYPVIPVNTEYTSAVSMPVAWINVCQDGTRSIDSTYAPSSTNPIVGRYAYWVDTETSKVNINTAGNAQLNYQGNAVAYAANGSGGTSPGTGDLQNLSGHPSRVDLSQLDGISRAQSSATYANTVSSYWQGPGLSSPNTGPSVRPARNVANNVLGLFRYNTIEDWINTPSGSITTSQIEQNKFYLTTRAWAPELTPWGLNKLWLQQNPPQTPTTNPFAFMPGNRLNAPGNPVYPPIASVYQGTSYNPTALGIMNYPLNSTTANLHALAADFRYYVYPPAAVSDTSAGSATDLLGTSFTTPMSGNFQYLGATSTWLSNATPLQAFMDNMMFQLRRSDWPGMPTKSFKDKYGEQECEDIAFNMASLLDSAVAGGTFAPFEIGVGNQNPNNRDPGGAFYGGGLFYYHDPSSGSGETQDRPFIGVSQGPYIKEISVKFTTTNSGGYTPTGTATSLVTDSTTGTSLNVADGADPGFAPPPAPNKDPSKPPPTYNVVIDPIIQLTYPTSLARTLPCYYGNSSGGMIYVGINSIEVTASGTYTPPASGVPQNITYTGSNFNWGYSKNTNTSAIGVASLLYYNTPNFTTTTYMTPGPPSASTEAFPNVYLTSKHLYIGPFDNDTQAVVTIKFRASIVRRNRWTGWSAIEFAPLPASLTSAYSDTDDSPSTKLSFTGTVTATAGGLQTYPTTGAAYDTKETSDPRDFRRVSDWIDLTQYPGRQNWTSFVRTNYNYYGLGLSGYQKDPLTGIVGDDSKLAWPDTSASANILNTQFSPSALSDPRWDQNAGNITGFPGIGWLSVIPTSCESSGSWSGNNFTPGTKGNTTPWRTLSLEPSQNTANLPDWLLLEAFSLAYDSTYLSQTQGKININPDIQPFGINRLKPLEALLIPSYDNTATSAASIAADLASYKGASDYSGLPSNIYLYPSEICQAPSMTNGGANQFQREALARDVVGLMTTQCSDFKVYVVAQSLAKNSDSSQAATAGPVLSEQRLEAVVSRAADVGPDNIPGTSDDPQALMASGSKATLKFDGTDPPLLGGSGAPPFAYRISNFQFMTQ